MCHRLQTWTTTAADRRWLPQLLKASAESETVAVHSRGIDQFTWYGGDPVALPMKMGGSWAPDEPRSVRAST